MRPRLRFRPVLLVPFLVGTVATAQSGATQTAVVPNVSGTVVNGLTGAPVARALVRLGARAVLTDSLGGFSFPAFSGTQAALQVTRPGYAASEDDPDQRTQAVIHDLTQPITVRIYPDAVISGVLTGSDRMPVAHAQVILLHETVRDGSFPRLFPAASTQTDSHGEYRFRQSPGRYRLLVPYLARAGQNGTTLLPVAFPEAQGTDLPPTFQVRSNEQRRIDLHVLTAESYPVRFRTGQEDTRSNPRVVVRTADGSTFSVFARSVRAQPGVFEILLPSGSYRIRATMQDRDGEDRNAQVEAEASITVAAEPLEGVPLHFEPLPALPIEISYEAAATGSPQQAQPPRLNNLGLRLQRLQAGDQLEGQEMMLGGNGSETPVVQIEPGIYRLRATFPTSWYVRQATYAGVDLLQEPFTVSGRDAEPMRLVLSNDAATLSGSVTGNDTAPAFVYLLAHQPGLLPVMMVQTSDNGTFTRQVPPGTYSVYAFSRRLAADLTDPQTVKRLVGGTEVELGASSMQTITLAVQPAVSP